MKVHNHIKLWKSWVHVANVENMNDSGCGFSRVSILSISFAFVVIWAKGDILTIFNHILTVRCFDENHLFQARIFISWKDLKTCVINTSRYGLLDHHKKRGPHLYLK